MTNFHHLLVQFELIFCTLYSERYISRKAQALCAVLLLKYRREEFPSTHWSQLAVERWRGGLSMALTFYFSGNCRIQPWSFPEACVHLIHPCAWMPAQGLCSFVSCSPNAPPCTQGRQHADAITSQIKFLI